MYNSDHATTLSSKFTMIGLSADWIFQTWLILGTVEKGIVIFENEDNSNYELIEFYYKGEERIEITLLSGSLNQIMQHIKKLKALP
ncbi:hypothetical protein [Aeromonas sp. s13]|uniref:hypothetical protein n=1 Tax=Aeromonas sp. s13 TaxID=3138483 RepID=UPI0034A437B9